MTLRPEYSLGHSEYNAFLFAAVGEEKVGLPLTVLTALTRLGCGGRPPDCRICPGKPQLGHSP
jgi:hypothetical protein